MLSLTCPPMYLSISFPPERAAGFWVYCNDRFQRGVKRKPMASIKKLREAVRKGRPQMVRSQREPLRTHLRVPSFLQARYAWKTWTHTSRFIPLK
nr:uncharacterized protein LOC118051491 isoform X6 [Populus alba]